MRKSGKCPKCGSSNLQDGTLFSEGGIWFSASVKRGLLNIFSPRSELSAMACLTCGHVEITLARIDKLVAGINKMHGVKDAEQPTFEKIKDD